MSSRFLLVLVALAAGCGAREPVEHILASGHVEATEVRVSTKVAGIVERLTVEEGDRLEAGQELARIDPTDLRLELDTARAESDQAEAELRLRLAGSRAEDVAEAAAQVRRAEAELAGGQKELDRMEGLLAAGSGTGKARDDAATRRDVAGAALQAARERLGRLKAGSRPEEIQSARARAAAGQARIAQLQQQIRDATILSPIAGIVTEKVTEQGELLARGAALAVVTDLSDAWLNAYVAETDLGRIRVGQDALVVTDDGQSRKGTISYVSSQAEFTPRNVQTRDERAKLVYKVKVALDNADGLFKPGMPAEARFAPAAQASR
jgi:HlyD family secretion protein